MDYSTTLKNLGIRVTSKRLAVLEFLQKSAKPVDIKTIKKELTKRRIKTDQVTLYRIIKIFQRAGLVKILDFLEGKFRYEFAKRSHHHHIICRSCGQIEDLNDEFFEDFIEKIRNKTNYMITDHILEFFGFCNKCQKN